MGWIILLKYILESWLIQRVVTAIPDLKPTILV